jgi:hypothetical protein
MLECSSGRIVAISAAHQPGTSPVARELPCNQVQFFKGFDVPDDAQRFDEFWIYYLRQHAKRGTRALHLIGTAIALLAIMAGILFGRALVAMLGIVLGYAVATSAHFIFEGNRPVMVHPLWSVQADLRMFWLWLWGRLGDELARAGLERGSN